MRKLHDPEVRRDVESRLAALRPDSPRQWGTMSPDQMLWHVNQFLEFALGEGNHEVQKLKIPAPIMRFFLLYMPWPKNAPTHPEARTRETYDFEAERKKCLALIDRFVARPLHGPWPVDAAWGQVNGPWASKLQAKHFEHHLSQFNV